MTKRVIITGASRGIGRATAQVFLDHNWQVINVSRSDCDIANVVNINLDLLSDFSEALETKLIPLLNDSTQLCVVHNAAMLTKETAQQIEPERLREHLELSVVAPSLINKKLIPLMPARSSIIFVGSTLSEIAVKNTACYVVSKHATAGLMKATCQDLAGTQIHTSCICPGFTKTDMLLTHLGHDEKILQALAQTNAMQRLIEPEEIAESIYFLSQNPVVNGSMFHANLGQLNT